MLFGYLKLLKTSNKDVDVGNIIRKQQIIKSEIDKLNNNNALFEIPDQEKM